MVVVVDGRLLRALLPASWLMMETRALLPFFDSGQQTPGTNKLWKQMDLRRLSNCRSKAGQLAKSRHEPRPPSGVVHGLDDEDDELGGSVLLGRAISTLFPEVIFSKVPELLPELLPDDDDADPIGCPVANGNKVLRVNLPS